MTERFLVLFYASDNRVWHYQPSYTTLAMARRTARAQLKRGGTYVARIYDMARFCFQDPIETIDRSPD